MNLVWIVWHSYLTRESMVTSSNIPSWIPALFVVSSGILRPVWRGLVWTVWSCLAWSRLVMLGVDMFFFLLSLCCLCLDLTHWGRVTHRCVSTLNSIGSDNGLAPTRRQAIIWTNAGTLMIWPLETHFSKMLIEIHTFSPKKMHLKMSSAKWPLSCLGFNLTTKLHVYASPIATLKCILSET